MIEMARELVGNRTFSQHGFALIGAGGAGAAAAMVFGINPLASAAIAILACLIDKVKEVVMLKHPFIAPNFILYDDRNGTSWRRLPIPSWSGIRRFTMRHCVRAGIEIGKAWGGSSLASISFPHAWVIGALGSHGARLGISLYQSGMRIVGWV